MPELNSDIQYLKGVGPAFAKKFSKLGIYTVRDLLLHYPRRYVDYSKPYTVASAPYDADCCVKATVLQREPDRRIKGGRILTRVTAADDTGLLTLSWFNASYAAQKLEPGTEYYFEGRVGGNLTHREILHPVIRTAEQVAAVPLMPVYGATEGLPASRIARCVQAALPCADALEDPLPPELLTRYRMPTKAQAVRAIHSPRDAADAAAARRRLIFEELYLLQLGIFLLRGHGRQQTGAPMRPIDLAPFWRSLPYEPTGAQRRAAAEITADLTGDAPMNRLLQGDVGSGKTLVAAAAIWFAAQNGWQSAMLAPTEILARQHAANLADLLEPFGINVTLLVGGMKAGEKKVALAAIADGRAGLVVGTHAVLTDSVIFRNLGLAIVDEQHRFGVRQRGLLAGKARNPHLLVMSATPIPRTLGLLMYGDLDISVLDELPPGRKPVRTWFITGRKRRDMYGYLEKQIAAGHQVYIVCPAIEENEMDAGMKAVKKYCEETVCPMLPGRRIGLLHGKMKPKEKDEVMQHFKNGELDVLVSTTVIEVGVDVPNATVMVIENAERFGLSSLHQLRGRVGRGAAESCCILVSDNESENVRSRLNFLCRTSDGFAVAKYDLETRGPGDFFGEAQHGLPTLRIADLVQDTRTLTVAQAEAKALLEQDPTLSFPEHKALSDEVERLFSTAGAMN
ncbi:MAG: ATP-dependent DNA helicase RecG [Oscillospiraceae bacterium]|nr:ATP-dependent DNA helicase RecG [Oscillospiraceae bacterium]